MFNIEKSRKMMSAKDLSVIVSLTAENSYYVSGTHNISHYMVGQARPIICVIPRDGDPTIIVQAWESVQTKIETWIKDIRTYEMFHSWVVQTPVEALIGVLKEKGLDTGAIGIEKEYITVNDYNKLIEEMPKARLEECGGIFREMRMIKSKEEIEIMSKGARATEKSILAAFDAARPGDTEWSLAENMTAELTRLGADLTFSPSFFLVLATGERKFINHPAPTQRQIKDGEILRVDFGGLFSGYHSDIARVAVVGRPAEEQLRAYDKLVTIVEDTVSSMRPGVRGSEVFVAGKEAYHRQGLPFGEDPSSYQLVGHGLGLELHEEPILSPTSNVLLQEGFVMSAEIMVRGKKELIHYEDPVVVTNKDGRLLSGIQTQLPSIR